MTTVRRPGMPPAPAVPGSDAPVHPPHAGQSARYFLPRLDQIPAPVASGSGASVPSAGAGGGGGSSGTSILLQSDVFTADGSTLSWGLSFLPLGSVSVHYKPVGDAYSKYDPASVSVNNSELTLADAGNSGASWLAEYICQTS